MRDYIANNLNKIEFGMHRYPGVEQCVEHSCHHGALSRVGVIDVLAADRSGTLVVVECKRGAGTASALGQVLAYVAYVTKCLRTLGRPVRAVIVAGRISFSLLLAASFVPHVPLMLFECTRPHHLRRVL